MSMHTFSGAIYVLGTIQIVHTAVDRYVNQYLCNIVLMMST